MQSITALAHLNACILYFIDISETCGYTIEQQISLFKNIKPLFQAKPLVIVLTKIDLVKFAELGKDNKALIEALAKEHNAYLIQMSNSTGDGISDVKQRACDILLDHRLTQKAKDPKKAEQIVNRIHVAQPKKRDNVDRSAVIPDTVTQGLKKRGPSIKELQDEFGGAGNFYIPVEEHYQLEDDDWKFDRWPEFYLGKNVMDFYDPEIEEKLKALEEEEDKLVGMEHDEQALLAADSDSDVERDGISRAQLSKSLKEVRSKKAIIKLNHKLKKNLRARSRNKKMSDLQEHMESKGIDANFDAIKARIKTRRSITDLEGKQDTKADKALAIEGEDGEEMQVDDGDRRGRKRKRSMSSDESMDESKTASKSVRNKSTMGRSLTPAQLKIRAQSKVRSMTQGRREGSVPQWHPTRVVPEEQIRLAKKINKRFKHSVNVNEADRVVTTAKPRHLFSGKRSNGTNDRR